MMVEAVGNASSSRQHIRDNSIDPEHEVSPSVFEDTVNLYMEKLYQEHSPNKKYDLDFPVFLDPCDHNRYILLTASAVQTWARALVS